jgi:hypothetical protein
MSCMSRKVSMMPGEPGSGKRLRLFDVIAYVNQHLIGGACMLVFIYTTIGLCYLTLAGKCFFGDH